MLPRSRLGSVGSRLLALLMVVIAPAALLTLLLAHSLLGAALENLQATQGAASRGRADMMLAWIDAAGRSLVNETTAAALLPQDRCRGLATAFLLKNVGFSSVKFYDEDGRPCVAGDALATLPEGETSPDAAYSLAAFGGRLWIVTGTGASRSALVADDLALRARMAVETAEGETHIVLLGPDREVLAADPASQDTNWRPRIIAAPKAGGVFRGDDLSGATAAFALAPVEVGFALLLRFDDRLYDAALRRFVVLCLAQLAMLGLLGYAFARGIRHNVVAWIERIDVAARSRGVDPQSRTPAPVSSKMPNELRSFAQSFNAMADRASDREEALEVSLGENRALMLEMHHRIKNSLQVIQSYLALIRRNGPRAEAAVIARIEARVGVLAGAYRLALSPNGMRPIVVKPFLEEIFAAASGGLRRPRQRASCEIGWDGLLIVDRAIPLGLALVEALIAAFEPAEVAAVSVALAVAADGEVELRVGADAAPSLPGLPEKVLRGLATQLGATPAPLDPGDILRWRFAP